MGDGKRDVRALAVKFLVQMNFWGPLAIVAFNTLFLAGLFASQAGIQGFMIAAFLVVLLGESARRIWNLKRVADAAVARLGQKFLPWDEEP